MKCGLPRRLRQPNSQSTTNQQISPPVCAARPTHQMGCAASSVGGVRPGHVEALDSPQSQGPPGPPPRGHSHVTVPSSSRRYRTASQDSAHSHGSSGSGRGPLGARRGSRGAAMPLLRRDGPPYLAASTRQARLGYMMLRCFLLGDWDTAHRREFNRPTGCYWHPNHSGYILCSALTPKPILSTVITMESFTSAEDIEHWWCVLSSCVFRQRQQHLHVTTRHTLTATVLHTQGRRHTLLRKSEARW